MSTKNLATQSQAPTHPFQPLPCASTEAKQAESLGIRSNDAVLANRRKPNAIKSGHLDHVRKDWI
jgi:hypothetical protein